MNKLDRINDPRGYWRAVILGSTAGLTGDKLEKAIDIAIETGCGAWHAAATAAGTKCSCAICRPDIKRYI